MKVSVILPAQEVSGQVVDGGQREGGRGVHLVQQPGAFGSSDDGDPRA